MFEILWKAGGMRGCVPVLVRHCTALDTGPVCQSVTGPRAAKKGRGIYGKN